MVNEITEAILEQSAVGTAVVHGSADSAQQLNALARQMSRITDQYTL